MRSQARRVAHLEDQVQVDAVGPSYVAVETLDELETLQLARRVKVYVGGSPDDWDEEVDVDE